MLIVFLTGPVRDKRPPRGGPDAVGSHASTCSPDARSARHPRARESLPFRFQEAPELRHRRRIDFVVDGRALETRRLRARFGSGCGHAWWRRPRAPSPTGESSAHPSRAECSCVRVASSRPSGRTRHRARGDQLFEQRARWHIAAAATLDQRHEAGALAVEIDHRRTARRARGIPAEDAMRTARVTPW